MSQILELELASDDGTATTVNIRRLGRALTPASLAALLASWLRTRDYQDPHTLGRMVGQELHSAPTMQRLAVRLLLGVVAGLAEYPPEWTDGHNMAAVQLARELTDAIDCGTFQLPEF